MYRKAHNNTPGGLRTDIDYLRLKHCITLTSHMHVIPLIMWPTAHGGHNITSGGGPRSGFVSVPPPPVRSASGSLSLSLTHGTLSVSKLSDYTTGRLLPPASRTNPRRPIGREPHRWGPLVGAERPSGPPGPPGAPGKAPGRRHENPQGSDGDAWFPL